MKREEKGEKGDHKEPKRLAKRNHQNLPHPLLKLQHSYSCNHENNRVIWPKLAPTPCWCHNTPSRATSYQTNHSLHFSAFPHTFKRVLSWTSSLLEGKHYLIRRVTQFIMLSFLSLEMLEGTSAQSPRLFCASGLSSKTLIKIKSWEIASKVRKHLLVVWISKKNWPYKIKLKTSDEDKLNHQDQSCYS